MYANGQGVPQNYPEALKWHRKAAEQGEPKAQFSVGVMYFKGLGTAKDHAEAFKWYLRAANQGEPAESMSAEQVDEAMKRVYAWQAKPEQ